jgi:DNA-dependent RNA polymerase auxiliary subunit epsilon
MWVCEIESASYKPPSIIRRKQQSACNKTTRRKQKTERPARETTQTSYLHIYAEHQSHTCLILLQSFEAYSLRSLKRVLLSLFQSCPGYKSRLHHCLASDLNLYIEFICTLQHDFVSEKFGENACDATSRTHVRNDKLQ